MCGGGWGGERWDVEICVQMCPGLVLSLFLAIDFFLLVAMVLGRCFET